MTNQERFEYFESGKLQRAVEVELLDWAGYWTTEGLDEITDPLQKAQTEQMIRLILRSLPEYIKQVSRLAISDSAIKTAESDPAESVIHTVVVGILATKLAWLTGISTVAE